MGIAGASLLVAFWAAWTAHQTRRWQRRRDIERRTTRVRLEFVHGSGPKKQKLVTFDSQVINPPPIVYTLSLAVINDGEEPEYVVAAFYKQATDADPTLADEATEDDPASMLRICGSEGDDTPMFELRPRAPLRIPIELATPDIEWMREGFVAEVWLGSGIRVRSAVETLMPELLGDLT